MPLHICGEQLAKTGSFLLPWGLWRLNSHCLSWSQALLPATLSLSALPCFLT